MACNSCCDGGGGPGNLDNLNPGQLVAITGKPLLSSTVDVTKFAAPGQFGPVLRYTYVSAAQLKGGK